MASQTDVVNIGLTLLGSDRILSIDDSVKAAREAKAIYDHVRDALLAGYNWTFAKSRASLSAQTAAPEFQFSKKYAMPSDCLRLLFIGDYYVGADLVDYRGSPSEEYEIEGRDILTDLGAPLNIKYVKRITNTAQYHPNFVLMFGAKLAYHLAEPLTQSASKQDRAENVFKQELKTAIRANAIEMPPTRLADDDWILSRQ